jgi:hypothetical protein
VGGEVLAATLDAPREEAASELKRLRSLHPRLAIQLVALSEVPGNRAVEMIGQQTLRASASGALLASRPEVDLLLRLAGTTQISEAIERSGYGAVGGGEEGRKLMLVAAGAPRAVAGLERALAADPRYRRLEGTEIGPRGLAMVETAALLGTRS